MVRGCCRLGQVPGLLDRLLLDGERDRRYLLGECTFWGSDGGGAVAASIALEVLFPRQPKWGDKMMSTRMHASNE